MLGRLLPAAVVIAAVLLVVARADAQPECDTVSISGESFTTLMSRLGADDTACLTAGTYDWGDFSVPAGKTIQGLDDPGAATIIGEARIENPGVTLSDLELQASSSETHAVIDVKADDFLADHVDVNVDGRPAQGAIVGGGTSDPANVRFLYSIFRNVAGGSRYHGIYWKAGTAPGEIGWTWAYNITGYSWHFFGSSEHTGVDIHNTVFDDGLTGRGEVLDGPDWNTLQDSVITDAGPINCKQPAHNQVVNVHAEQGFIDCPGTEQVIARTVYADEAARDYGNRYSGFFAPGARY